MDDFSTQQRQKIQCKDNANSLCDMAHNKSDQLLLTSAIAPPKDDSILLLSKTTLDSKHYGSTYEHYSEKRSYRDMTGEYYCHIGISGAIPSDDSCPSLHENIECLINDDMLKRSFDTSVLISCDNDAITTSGKNNDDGNDNDDNSDMFSNENKSEAALNNHSSASYESLLILLEEKDKQLQRKSEEHVADMTYMKSLMEEMYVEGNKLRKELQRMKFDYKVLQNELYTMSSQNHLAAHGHGSSGKYPLQMCSSLPRMFPGHLISNSRHENYTFI